MTAHSRYYDPPNDGSPEAPIPRPHTVILLILMDASKPDAVNGGAVGPGTLAIDFEDLTNELIESVDPSVVVTSLLSRGFDCTDVARVLVDVGYDGEFRVVSKALPRPEAVEKELRSTYPTLDIDLWILPTIA